MKIGIQKSGRLRRSSESYLSSLGWRRSMQDALIKTCPNDKNVQFVYVRQGDLPKLLASGTIDVAIIGKNELLEQGQKLKIISELDFGKCQLSIAVPKAHGNEKLSNLNGKKIATSYPNSLKRYMKKKNIDSEIITLSGSVEIAPQLGLADAICDIVQTGSTLRENGLVAVDNVYLSRAVVVVSRSIKEQDYKKLTERINNENLSILPAKQS